MNPPTSSIKWVAIIAIIATGIIHFIEAPDNFADAAYVGALFVANGVGGLVAAVGIVRGQRWGWILGLLVAAGAIVGYVVSRTVGLPGLPAEPENWFEPTGVAAMICEGIFVVLFIIAWRRQADVTA